MATITETLNEALKAHEAGNVQQAEIACRQVLKADPNQPDALNLLGVMANQLGMPEAAVEFFRRALQARPGSAEVHSNFGEAAQAAGDVAAAVHHFQQALWLRPDLAILHTHLSQALMIQGKVDAALSLARKALEVQPDSAAAFGRLGQLAVEGHGAFSEEEIQRMQTLLDEGRHSPHDAAILGFTLGAHWDRKGQYDEAFRRFHQANELKREADRRAQREFSRPKHVELIDSLVAAFTRELFARARSFGSDSEVPVFVVGMPRSGTSLVEQILASHPQVHGAGELNDLRLITMALPARLRSSVDYPWCLDVLEGDAIQILAGNYVRRVTHLSGGTAARVVDKLPANFLHLGLIALLFPRARIIHCRREPMDVCLSVYFQNFKGLPFANSLEDIGFYYRTYERIMEHWKRVLPVAPREVAYEELVAAPAVVSRKLVEFCGLPWDDRCLSFHKTQREVATASMLQVRQPIYDRSVSRWRRYERYLEPLRQAQAEAATPAREAEATPTPGPVPAGFTDPAVRARAVLEAKQLMLNGNLARAEVLCRQVLKADPRMAEATFVLGAIAKRADKPDAAINLLQQALAIQPGVFRYHYELGTVYRTVGDVLAAIDHFEMALKLQPGEAEVHARLSDAFVIHGNIDAARHHGLEALRLDPNHASAWTTLGSLVTEGYYAFSDDEVRRMQDALAAGTAAGEDACHVAFTLAGHWDKKGEYDEAFRCYRRANELKLQIFAARNDLFQPRNHFQYVNDLIAAFTPEYFERARALGGASEVPVFVVGMPRSGTSLVEQIVASHPQAFGAGELLDLNRLAEALPRRLGSTARYPGCMAGLDVAAAQAVAASYLEGLCRRSGAAARVVDKMPQNFLHLGLIAVLFPRARIVHCRRHPLDVCLSAYFQNFARVTFASRLDDLGFFYRQYQRIMDHWQRVLPVPIHEVHYEELVADQEAVSRRLVDFCGLDWDERCLNFHKKARVVRTASRLQVRQPIYNKSVARWKRYEAHLGPLQQALALAETEVPPDRQDAPEQTAP